MEVEIDLWNILPVEKGTQGSHQTSFLTINWKLNGRIKRASAKIKIGDALSKYLECSNNLKAREDLQDGHQMTVKDASQIFSKNYADCTPHHL